MRGMMACKDNSLTPAGIVVDKAGSEAAGSTSSEKHHYSCKSYSSKLITSLHALWTLQQLCDVELTAGSYTVKVRLHMYEKYQHICLWAFAIWQGIGKFLQTNAWKVIFV